VVAQLKADIEGPEGTAYEESALRAWTAWRLSQALGETYGARSFGLIALAVGFEQMRALDEEARTASYRPRR
jgi:RNA-dependent RNA polymerase